MAEKIKKELVGADDFITEKTFICEDCFLTICTGKPAVMATYMTAPKLLIGCTIIDEERSYIFKKMCGDCGEILRISRRV